MALPDNALFAFVMVSLQEVMEIIPRRMVITSKCCKADIRLYVTNPCGYCAARKVHVMGGHEMETICVKCKQIAVMRSEYPTMGKFQ